MFTLRRKKIDKMVEYSARDIINKGKYIIHVLERLKKRVDKRASTSLLNIFSDGEWLGVFLIVDILLFVIGLPRLLTDMKTLDIDEKIKRELNEWVKMVLPMPTEVKQKLKGSYIQDFLQEKSILKDSISGKSDKDKAGLIQNVIDEVKWNITVIENCG